MSLSFNSMTDADLMLHFSRGENPAFDELFRRYEKRILNYVFRFFPIRSVAEEITQDVFLRLFKARGKYEPKAAFSTWLFTIATNVCLKQLRRKEHRYRQLSLDQQTDAQTPWQAVDTRTPSAQEELEQLEQRRLLQRAINGLAPKQKAVVIMRNYQEMSHQEIGQVMKMSESAVKSLLSRAYGELKRKTLKDPEKGSS